MSEAPTDEALAVIAQCIAPGAVLAAPYLVLEFIEGEAEHSPADAAAYTAQMAAELARIHRVDPTLTGLAFLRKGDDWLADVIRERSVEVDNALKARDIRAAPRTSRPLAHPNPPVLLHGDPWPGNTVWRDGRLVAMIDWEEAHIGDPLEDLAVARFDMLCMLGRGGMEQYTHAYTLARPQVDLTDLPYWDLYAALRPVSNIAEWAGGWRDLGRPDITEGVLRAAHCEFVAQAFDQITGRSGIFGR